MSLTKFFRLAPFLALAFFVCACASNDRSIVPIPLSEKIDVVYVVNDPAMAEINDNIMPEIVGQLSAMGYIPYVVTADAVPASACRVTYSARMTGHPFKTMSYLRIEVRKGNRMLGFGFSDVSGSVDRYNSTSERVRQLMEGMFRYTARPGSAR